MAEKKVFIIILNYNSSAETLSLFTLLSEQTYKVFEIVIIDNHSKDDSLAKLTEYIGSTRLIKNRKNLGYAGGNNIGIDIAIDEHSDYVWILNPDIKPDPDTLSILVESMEKDSSLAAIGPRICYRDKSDIIYSDGGLIYPEKGYLVVHKNHNKKIESMSSDKISLVDYANGSVILIRTKSFKDIGKFRKDFFLYYEEAEWCLRAKGNGWNIATNCHAKVYHKSSLKGIRYNYYMARNRILLAKVLGKFRLQAVKIELDHLLRLLKCPTYHNLIYFTVRFTGIFCGLIRTPMKIPYKGN